MGSISSNGVDKQTNMVEQVSSETLKSYKSKASIAFKKIAGFAAITIGLLSSVLSGVFIGFMASVTVFNIALVGTVIVGGVLLIALGSYLLFKKQKNLREEETLIRDQQVDRKGLSLLKEVQDQREKALQNQVLKIAELEEALQTALDSKNVQREEIHQLKLDILKNKEAVYKMEGHYLAANLEHLTLQLAIAQEEEDSEKQKLGELHKQLLDSASTLIPSVITSSNKQKIEHYKENIQHFLKTKMALLEELADGYEDDNQRESYIREALANLDRKIIAEEKQMLRLQKNIPEKQDEISFLIQECQEKQKQSQLLIAKLSDAIDENKSKCDQVKEAIEEVKNEQLELG